MKIYFAGSIRGGRDDRELYVEVIKLLQSYGTVLTEHIANKNLTQKGETQITDEFIYQRDVDWLTEADVVVAEVTNVSLGVGYELGKSEELNKKVICLYRPSSEKRLSAMVAGNKHFTIINYSNLSELPSHFDKLLRS